MNLFYQKYFSALKILTIFIYILSIIAILSIIIGFISNAKMKKVGDSEVENIVLKIYDLIDRGDYKKLYNFSIEGEWVDTEQYGSAKYYILNGLVDENDFIDNAIKDYGEDGWRLHFTSLDIIDINKVSEESLSDDLQPEYEILKLIKRNEKNNKNSGLIYIVNIKGFIVGSCAITNWNKNLPLIWTDKGWKAIVSGTPEDLRLVHRDLWLANINFRISKK